MLKWNAISKNSVARRFFYIYFLKIQLWSCAALSFLSRSFSRFGRSIFLNFPRPKISLGARNYISWMPPSLNGPFVGPKLGFSFKDEIYNFIRASSIPDGCFSRPIRFPPHPLLPHPLPPSSPDRLTLTASSAHKRSRDKCICNKEPSAGSLPPSLTPAVFNCHRG